MTYQTSNDIKIIVRTKFEGTFVKDAKIKYAFSYQITIQNHSNYTVQLISRYWEILDALNNLEIVEGEGVIGNQPIIGSNESFTYESFCLLNSPIGAMKGHYVMKDIYQNNSYKVAIPKFKLNAPFAIN